MKDRVQISFDGKLVDVVWVTVVNVRHIGNDAIPADAFVEPIKLGLPADAQLLDVTLSGDPAGDGAVDSSGHSLLIAPRLINPRDLLRISCVADRKMDCTLQVRASNTELRWLKREDPEAVPLHAQIQLYGSMILMVLAMVLLWGDMRDGHDIRNSTLILLLIAAIMLLAQRFTMAKQPEP